MSIGFGLRVHQCHHFSLFIGVLRLEVCAIGVVGCIFPAVIERLLSKMFAVRSIFLYRIFANESFQEYLKIFQLISSIFPQGKFTSIFS
jgi:uncharacterized membrane protein YbaN (DUF454 family)